LGFMSRVGSEIAVAPSASGHVLLAFQEGVIQGLRIKESLPKASEVEIEQFKAILKEVKNNGFASIKSNQYAGLHAISFPILDLNGNAMAALTVPMLARIDGETQASQQEVEAQLRKSVEQLSQKIKNGKSI
jgi:DNA-binding IclR family transcriptional regulator